jgi:hypothetical protein
VPNVVVEVVERPVVITVDKEITYIDAGTQTVSLELGISGPQGPAGPPGVVDASSISYVHTQSIALDTWVINHGLNFIPGITVVDSAGTVVEGSYNYPDENTVVATFSGAFSGKAYLS